MVCETAIATALARHGWVFALFLHLAAPCRVAAGVDLAPPAGTREGGENGARATGPLLTGRVLEKGSGNPLEGVAVVLEGTDTRTETDPDGRYLLRMPRGWQTILFECPGYKPHRMEFLFKTLDVDLPPIYLEPLEAYRPAMVVETRRDVSAMNLEVLLPEEIARYPSTHGDPVRATESYPNVARSKFLDSALVVRGAEPANTVVLVEGHRVPFLYHFGIWKSVINPHFLQSIDYYPGGMPSSYGNVLQAVLDVQPRDLPVDRAHGVADINLADTALTLTTPLLGGRAALGMAGRFSYLSLLLLGGSAVAGTEQIVFPRYSDYQVRLVSRGLGGTWSLLALGARDAVRVGDQWIDADPATEARVAAYGVDQQVPYITQFHHVHLNYQRTGMSPFSLTSSFAGGWDQEISQLPLFDFFNTALAIPSLTRMDRWMAGNRTELTWKQGERLEAAAGWELFHSRARIMDLTDLWSSPDTPIPAPEVKPVTLLAGYSRLTWRPGHGWTLVPEFRATWYAYNGRTDPFAAPRATVRQALTERLTLKTAAGLFSQLPDERDYSRRGNPSLGLMKALQASAGVECDLHHGMGLESTLFASRMWDLTLNDVDLEYQDMGHAVVYQPVEVFFEGNGRAYGGEVTWRLRGRDGGMAMVSYSYTRSLRQFSSAAGEGQGEPGGKTTGTGAGETGEWIPGDYDQPHTLTALATWPLPRRWFLGARFRLGSGQPYTPFQCAWEASRGSYYPLEGARNSARGRLFHQLDVRIDRTVLKDTWRMNVYIDIQNVYNAKNPIVELPNWNCSGSGSAVWVPLVPAFGLKGEF